MNNIKNLYKQHLDNLTKFYNSLISKTKIKGIILHSGKEEYYFQDDEVFFFKPFPHFSHWTPYQKQDSFIVIEEGKKPTLYFMKFDDFWHEPVGDISDFWVDFFNVKAIKNTSEFYSQIKDVKNYVYLGNNPEEAIEKNINPENTNPDFILKPLDYNRRLKDEYEIYCTEEATKIALEGYKAIKKAFYDGKSEFDINIEYLKATKQIENDTPYPSIIALNEKASILHYEKRRHNVTGKYSFLVDAGATYNRYACDISRTFVAEEHTNSMFTELLKRMEKLQLSIISSIKVGLPYIELQKLAHKLISEILSESHIIRLSADDIFEQNISSIFFPHGPGHLLGIQTHDTNGHYKNDAGEKLLPPEQYPFLRLTQTIEKHHLFTIEPGFYFIRPLLDKLKNDKKLSSLVTWELISELEPFGGIRIEDNIYVLENSILNITRKYFDKLS